MKPKLRKLGGGLLILRLREGNPNPLANDFGQLIRTGQTALQQIENLLSRQLAIRLPLLAVNVKKSTRLCRCLWCCRYRLRCRLMIAGLDSELWR